MTAEMTGRCPITETSEKTDDILIPWHVAQGP